MPDLYVVNTKINPGFINPRSIKPAIWPVQVQDEHNAFIRKVRACHPDFGLPYFALFDDGTYHVPTPGPLRGGVVGNWCHSHTTAGLACEIDRYAVGNGTIEREKVIPITAVVEFSADELCPGAMAELEELYGYTIKRIRVD